jgi:L-seryl-tRNA(Ser) seleniumtransferase
MIEDIGSGCLLEITDFGVPQALREPRPQESLAAGASIVMFSGDKLLGGPQAGIIAGEPDLIARIRHHPLARALRLDKLGVAALAATLGHYRRGDAPRTVPVWQMIGATSAVLATRATAIASKLGMGGSEVRVIAGVSAIGGGSLPGVTLPTSLVAVTPLEISAEGLATRLRHPNPMAPDLHALRSRKSSSVSVDPEASGLQDAVTIPVVARIEHDTVLFDPRTVMPDEDDALVRMIRRANLPR